MLIMMTMMMVTMIVTTMIVIKMTIVLMIMLTMMMEQEDNQDLEGHHASSQGTSNTSKTQKLYTNKKR